MLCVESADAARAVSHEGRARAAQEALHEARQARLARPHHLLCIFQLKGHILSDGSGSIDREEFLQIPQIATNPLASRMIAIFDEECVPAPPSLSSVYAR
jgi:hypothetical protein